MKLLTLAAGALALALTSCTFEPAYAQSCQYTYDAERDRLLAQGLAVVELEPDTLAAAEQAAGVDASRGFVVTIPGGRILLGLEVDGCLLPPIPLDAPPEPRLSGAVGGRFYA